MIGNHDDRDVFQTVFPDNPCDQNNFVQTSFETSEGIFLFLDTKKKVKMCMTVSCVKNDLLG